MKIINIMLELHVTDEDALRRQADDKGLRNGGLPYTASFLEHDTPLSDCAIFLLCGVPMNGCQLMDGRQMSEHTVNSLAELMEFQRNDMERRNPSNTARMLDMGRNDSLDYGPK